LGGTIVVHFIKKHMWFFETALALLEGDEETEYEIQRRLREEILNAKERTVLSRTTARPHRSQLEIGPPALHVPGMFTSQAGADRMF
jgi:hypothetical protein